MDDKEKQDKQYTDAEAKAEAELLDKILQDILADDENIYYFLLPLLLQDTYKTERHIISYAELQMYMLDLKGDKNKLANYKEKLKQKISFSYIYACGLLFTNTTNIRASEMIRTYLLLLYDINQIPNAEVRKIKLLFLQNFIDEKLSRLGDIFLKVANGFKEINNSKQKIITATDEEYSEIINSVNYETFKLKDTIKSKDDVLAFIKKQESNLKTFYAIQRKLEDFTDYLLGTETDKQTIKDYENRFIDNTSTSYTDDNKVIITGIFFRNIYTNYDIKTDDGEQNYKNKMQAVQDKYEELWQLIYTKKEPITLDEVAKALSFKADERDLLKNKSDELAGLESVGTPTKPNSFTYVTNKVQRNLDKVESLTEIDKDLLPISLSKHRGDIVINASMKTMQDAIYKLNLSKYDILIHTASKSLLKNNKEINTDTIFDYLTGDTGERPNKTALADIEKSLDTLSDKKIRLSYATDKQLKSKTDKKETIQLDFEAPLLPLKKLKVKYKGKEHTFYRLIGTYEENDYFKFIDNLGQLASVPTKYLNTGGSVRNTSENILINNYLTEQIVLMRSGSLDTNKISYDKIYALCGVEDTTDPTEAGKIAQRKNRIRANVANILKGKKKLGFIKDYKENKEKQGTAHRVAGIEIFTENDKKKQ